MKTEHDYFKSYLCRLFAYESNRCNENCNEKQTFEHLLFYCRHYVNEQNELKNNMKIFVTLRTLFNTDEDIKNVLNFIKKYQDLYEKVNFRHDKERKNTHRKMRKSKVDKEALERFSKIREKNKAKKERRRVFIRHLFDAK